MLIPQWYKELPFSKLLVMFNIVIDNRLIGDLDKINTLNVSFKDMKEVYVSKESSNLLCCDNSHTNGKSVKPSKLRVMISCLYNCPDFKDCLYEPYRPSDFKDEKFLESIEKEIFTIINTYSLYDIFSRYMKTTKWTKTLGSCIGNDVKELIGSSVITQDEVSHIQQAWIKYSLCRDSFLTNFIFQSDESLSTDHSDLDRYLSNSYNTIFSKSGDGSDFISSYRNSRGSSVNTSATDGDVSVYDNMLSEVELDKNSKTIDFRQIAQNIYSASSIMYRTDDSCYMSIYEYYVKREVDRKSKIINKCNKLKSFRVQVISPEYCAKGSYDYNKIKAKDVIYDKLIDLYFNNNDNCVNLWEHYESIYAIDNTIDNDNGKRVFGTNNVKGNKLSFPTFSLFLKLVYGFSSLRVLRDYCVANNIDFCSIDGKVFRDERELLKYNSLEEYLYKCKIGLQLESPNNSQVPGLLSNDNMLAMLYTNSSDLSEVNKILRTMVLPSLTSVKAMCDTKDKSKDPYLEYAHKDIKYIGLINNFVSPLYNIDSGCRDTINKLNRIKSHLKLSDLKFYDLSLSELSLELEKNCEPEDKVSLNLDLIYNKFGINLYPLTINKTRKEVRVDYDMEIDDWIRVNKLNYPSINKFSRIVINGLKTFISRVNEVKSSNLTTNDFSNKNLFKIVESCYNNKIISDDDYKFVKDYVEKYKFISETCTFGEWVAKYTTICNSIATIIKIKNFLSEDCRDYLTTIDKGIRIYNNRFKELLDFVNNIKNSPFVSLYKICIDKDLSEFKVLDLLQVCDCLSFICNKISNFYWNLCCQDNVDTPLLCINYKMFLEPKNIVIENINVTRENTVRFNREIPLNIFSSKKYLDYFQGFQAPLYRNNTTMDNDVNKTKELYFNSNVNTIKVLPLLKDFITLKGLITNLDVSTLKQESIRFSDLEFFCGEDINKTYNDYTVIYNRVLGCHKKFLQSISVGDIIFNYSMKILESHTVNVSESTSLTMYKNKYDRLVDDFLLANKDIIKAVSMGDKEEFNGLSIDKEGFYLENGERKYSEIRSGSGELKRFYFHSSNVCLSVNLKTYEVRKEVMRGR